MKRIFLFNFFFHCLYSIPFNCLKKLNVSAVAKTSQYQSYFSVIHFLLSTAIFAMMLPPPLLRAECHQKDSLEYLNSLIISTTLKSQNETFKNSIKEFVCDAEGSQCKTYILSTIAEKYKIQKRRLYDLVNVLEAAGALTKVSVDTIIWEGLNNVSVKLSNLFLMSQSYGPQYNFNMLFRDKNSISISHLTENFLLSFFFLRSEKVNIKRICSFLSRENGRYKTTLCKLYQIAHILEAAGVLSKTSIPGEIYINSSFLVPKQTAPKRKPFITPIISYSPPPEPVVSIQSIESLLNKHDDDSKPGRKIFPSLI